jgi:hypothetical protein
MENRKRALHFISVTAFVIFIVLGLACATAPRASNATQEDNAEIIDFTYPLEGITNSVKIAGKDFTPVGIVFLNSEEKIDSRLSAHTGSKITYEMFMREAARLGADDVINIKIDVRQERATVAVGEGESRKKTTITTFMYTGTGLAIKYTDAIVSNDVSIPQNTAPTTAPRLFGR